MMSQKVKSYVNIKSHSAPNTSAKECKLILLEDDSMYKLKLKIWNIILGYKFLKIFRHWILQNCWILRRSHWSTRVWLVSALIETSTYARFIVQVESKR